jgi:hypothetical protein
LRSRASSASSCSAGRLGCGGDPGRRPQSPRGGGGHRWRADGRHQCGRPSGAAATGLRPARNM